MMTVLLFILVAASLVEATGVYDTEHQQESISCVESQTKDDRCGTDYDETTMTAPVQANAVIATFALNTVPWKTFDPFLFCVYHNDKYPTGHKGTMGPDPKLLRGRSIGQDFSSQDGWSMYHGERVPGFPAHPHRGFETLTVLQQGLVDHTDSLGCTGRYGQGDTQWVTAGKGIQHAEMFPLVHEEGAKEESSSEKSNELELFQIWLNLPARSKFVDPSYNMFWGPNVPKACAEESSCVEVIAGEFPGQDKPLQKPPPDSWASQPGADVAVWVGHVGANGGSLTLPPAKNPKVQRTLYFYDGDALIIDKDEKKPLKVKTAARLNPEVSCVVSTAASSPSAPAHFLLLQGLPIGEPVVQHGPFVMNTREEISQAFTDYQRTQFGGWPWKQSGPVNPAHVARFATFADGRKEDRPEK